MQFPAQATNTNHALTTSEVADYLGVTRHAVHQFIRDGRLPAWRANQSWFIWRSDLEAFDHVLPPNSRAGCPNKAVERAEAQALRVIAEHPGITVVGLSEITGEVRGTALTRLQRLERHGLIVRTPGAVRTPHQCHLTDAGWRQYNSELLSTARPA